MAKFRWNQIFVILILGIIFSCAPTRVTIQHDKEINFTSYKTFCLISMLPPLTKTMRNSLWGKEVLIEINSFLKQKGLREGQNFRSADLLVYFYVFGNPQSFFAYPMYHLSPWARVWSEKPYETLRNKNAMVVIDIVDQSSQKLIWEGVGTVKLKENSSPNILKCVQKILAHFP